MRLAVILCLVLAAFSARAEELPFELTEIDCATWLIFSTGSVESVSYNLRPPVIGTLAHRQSEETPITAEHRQGLASVLSSEAAKILNSAPDDAHLFVGEDARQLLVELGGLANFLWAASVAQDQHNAERRWQRGQVFDSRLKVMCSILGICLSGSGAALLGVAEAFWPRTLSWLPSATVASLTLGGALGATLTFWQSVLWRDRRREVRAEALFRRRFHHYLNLSRRWTPTAVLLREISERVVPFSTTVAQSGAPWRAEVGLTSFDRGPLEPFVLLLPAVKEK